MDIGVQPIVETVNLGFRYGANRPWIFKNTDLSIGTSEVVCFVGANGIGKTTLAKLLAGELEPAVGEVRRQKGIRAGMRYQQHEKNLLPWYSAEHNLELISQSDTLDESLSEWLEVARYDSWKDQRVMTLSGGQKQLLSTIGVLGLGFDLTILDEPFNAIDPARVTELWRLLRDWLKLRASGVVVITHNLDEAIALGDRIILLLRPDRGNLAEYEIERSGREKQFLATNYAQRLHKVLVERFYGIN